MLHVLSGQKRCNAFGYCRISGYNESGLMQKEKCLRGYFDPCPVIQHVFFGGVLKFIYMASQEDFDASLLVETLVTVKLITAVRVLYR